MVNCTIIFLSHSGGGWTPVGSAAFKFEEPPQGVERKMVRKSEWLESIKDLTEGEAPDVKERMMRKARTKVTRRSRTPVPPGGISIREAARTFSLDSGTLSRWVKQGKIPVIQETANEKFVDRATVARIAELYNTDPGRGKRTVSTLQPA